MSLASSLLSELEGIGSFHETVSAPSPAPAPIPTLELVLDVPPKETRLEQVRVQAVAAVSERIIERLDGFAQMFQDLKEDFSELRRLWSPVEEVEPKEEISEYELEVTEGGEGDDYDDEDTEDVEV
jgi:hypothetical protein